ncbi:MAG TPA: sugar phosphate nucleotidyltransferase [Anaerolineales bacterium]|jgi:glucose-1-phosphate thymidylyltransferase
MRIVIPTAGFGTRLRPHTWSKPKPMVSVAGKPVLGHVLDLFKDLPQIDELVFIIGYLGEQIEAYVSQAYPNLPARYVVQEEMLGQSHAIWLARQGLSGPMLMVFVDTLIETDLSGLPQEPAEAVAWVKPVEDPRRFGVADVGPDGWVTRLVEKPQDVSNNLAVVGFYYFNAAERLLAAIEQQIESGDQLKGEWYLADAINLMLQSGLRMRAETVEVWKDCGKPDALLDTNRYLLDNGRDNGAEFSSGDIDIVAPVYIDPSATVRDSTIGPYASIGADCVIEDSRISNSIIDRGTRLENADVLDSVVGRDALVRGGPVRLNVGDESQVELG